MQQEKKYGEIEIEKAVLEPWENPAKENDYIIEMSFPEFSCLCPRSGYPDYATIKIRYIPNEYIVELKSLKLWLNSFRNQYISHEAATNTIYNKLFELLKPKFLEVIGDFHPRGNLHTVVRVRSDKKYD